MLQTIMAHLKKASPTSKLIHGAKYTYVPIKFILCHSAVPGGLSLFTNRNLALKSPNSSPSKSDIYRSLLLARLNLAMLENTLKS